MQKKGGDSLLGRWLEEEGGGGWRGVREKHVFWTITGLCSPKIKTEQKSLYQPGPGEGCILPGM